MNEIVETNIQPIAASDRLWAKSASAGQARGESLFQHTKNVVHALADLRRLRPNLPDEVGNPHFWHLAFWACVLHDFGKAAEGFQRQVKPGGARWGKRHEVLSLAFLDWLLSDRAHPDRVWLSSAIASHHKDRRDIETRYRLDQDPEDDVLVDMVQELSPAALDELWEILTVHAPLWRQQYGFDEAGVVEMAFTADRLQHPDIAKHGRDLVAEALRSYYRLAHQLTRDDARSDRTLLAVALRGTIITADHQASAYAFGVHAPPLDGPSELLRRLDRDWEKLHQHQRDAAQSSGSRLLTAPTGSGKTEAALLWASNQALDTPTPRLFYVLPFQASMNAMHRRLDVVFPKDVGLQHGRSLHALYRQLLEAEPTPQNAERLARREKNLAGLHYHPVRVLSPYQLLKACYRLRGYEAILTDLYGGLFVLDEIHAYEAKRLALLLKMFEHLRRHYGARFFVMTATLPTLVRHVLDEALALGEPITATSDLYEQYCRHTLQLLDGDLFEDGIAPIMAAVADGRSVLVCCNTVRRAQEVWQRLSAVTTSTTVELLHSGFNARDRLQKENAILRDIAAGSARHKQVVLVATQVVEVSLNIDFDALFTDPAPLEALLQRFGRVNRLGSRGLAPVYVFTRPDDGQHVYDADLVRATLMVLSTINGSPIDEAQTGAWLDQIYAGEHTQVWQKEFTSTAAEFDTTCLACLHPFQSDDALEELFYQAFDAVEVLPVSLEAEFQALRDERPLEADSLLVNIRSSRYGQLLRKGKVLDRKALAREESWPHVIDVPYSSETGLSSGGENDHAGKP